MQGQSVEAGGYELERFVPLLQEVLEDHIAGTLKQDDFPYVNPPMETGRALKSLCDSMQCCTVLWKC